MKEYIVPVFIVVHAKTPKAAREKVLFGLGNEFEWPFPVVASTIGNEDEVKEEE